MISRLCFFAILAAISVTPALATTIFTWSFDQPTYTTGSSATIDVATTVTNTGTTDITSYTLIGFGIGTITPFLTAPLPTVPTPSFSSAFTGIDLKPGNSVSFDFIDISFNGATPGTYSLLNFAALELKDDTTGTTSLVTFTTNPPLPIVNVVPEPSGLVLLGTGALGLLETARRKLRVPTRR
jgi:hypothetical protein